MKKIPKIKPYSVRYCRDRAKVSGPGDAMKFASESSLCSQPVENFAVLVLDARHCVKRMDIVHVGTLNASLVHPREVFIPAIEERGAAVIVMHNHPSGCPKPSSDNLEITRRLSRCGHLLGIEVLDHVVVADDSYESIREYGWPDSERKAW